MSCKSIQNIWQIHALILYSKIGDLLIKCTITQTPETWARSRQQDNYTLLLPLSRLRIYAGWLIVPHASFQATQNKESSKKEEKKWLELIENRARPKRLIKHRSGNNLRSAEPKTTPLSLSLTPFIDSTRVHPIINLARHLLNNITREHLHRLWRNKQINLLYELLQSKNFCMRHLCPVREPQKPEGGIHSQLQIM